MAWAGRASPVLAIEARPFWLRRAAPAVTGTCKQCVGEGWRALPAGRHATPCAAALGALPWKRAVPAASLSESGGGRCAGKEGGDGQGLAFVCLPAWPGQHQDGPALQQPPALPTCSIGCAQAGGKPHERRETPVRLAGLRRHCGQFAPCVPANARWPTQQIGKRGRAITSPTLASEA